jgi:hypothetical protein
VVVAVAAATTARATKQILPSDCKRPTSYSWAYCVGRETHAAGRPSAALRDY